MALSHILDAVSASAEEQIQTLTDSHEKRVLRMRESADGEISEIERTVRQRTDEQCRQLASEAEARSIQEHGARMLAARREVLDEVYEETLQEVGNLPEDRIKPLVLEWVHSLPLESKGVVYPAERHEQLIRESSQKYPTITIGNPIRTSGGFRFESEKEERNYTFEGIVDTVLRPKTERAVVEIISKR